MTERTETVKNLKDQLTTLQDKISELEQKPQSPKKQPAIKTLFRWQSFTHQYSRHNSRWFINSFLLVATIILILLFIKEFYIVAAVLAVAFVAYVLAAIPPELIENAITTQGINIGNHSYIWEELDEFWLTEKAGFVILHIDTFLSWPRRLFVLINEDDREKIRELIARYIPFREIPKTTWIDTLGETLSKGFHKLTT